MSETRLDTLVASLRVLADRPDEITDIAALIRACVQGLRPGLAPTHKVDSRITADIGAAIWLALLTAGDVDVFRVTTGTRCRRSRAVVHHGFQAADRL